MKIRDHDQKCEHGHSRGHWVNIRIGSAYPSNVSIPAPSDPNYEWCDGGVELILEIAAGYLSTIEWIPAEYDTEMMLGHLKAALGYRVETP